MGVQSNETRKQTGHENAQRQDEKNRQDFDRENPHDANPQMRNKQGEGCETDLGKAEQGQHCSEQDQDKNKPQAKGQGQSQHQHK